MQQHAVQRDAGPDARATAFCLAVLGELIKDSSGDKVWLASHIAARRLGVSDEDAKKFLETVMSQAGSNWPKGFL
jgi:hypothetical protein